MLRLTACAAAFLTLCTAAQASESNHSAELDAMIARQAKRHGVPEKLVRRIVMRESNYNPRARNRSFWGLMQISYPTARSMGFKGSPSDLLDPLVNLTYAVPYLANAFIIAGKQEDAAVRLYASGYYATAKNRNLLSQLRTAESQPMGPDDDFLTATARPVSNLITAVISGPPVAQQVAEAAPTASVAPAAAQAETGGGKANEAQIAMVHGKNSSAPPSKWIKDGGVSLVARGEQRIEQVAAYSPPAEAAQPKSGRHRSAAHGKSTKTTEFASLDAPPPGVQAYAAPAPAIDSGPQAAIAQATSNSAAANISPADEAPRAKSGHATSSKALRARKTLARGLEGVEPASTADASSPPARAGEPAETSVKRKVRVAAAKKTAHAVSLAAKADEPPAQEAR